MNVIAHGANYFLAIAGNIGVGKSTLTRLLADKLQLHPMLEAPDDNPFLSDFYSDMHRWAFHSQIHFLGRRLHQHVSLLRLSKPAVQDRCIYEDANVFARSLHRHGYLSDPEWRAYFALYEALLLVLRPPSLVLYLKASVSTLMRRIAHRGRQYEQAISEQYLVQLNTLYEEWVADFSLCPILTVETDDIDYVQHEEHLDAIARSIGSKLYGKDIIRLGAVGQ